MFRTILTCAMCAVAAGLAFLSVPAHAAWHEASSEHFVIYADQSPKAIQEYGERLEKFHAAMTYVVKSKGHAVSPSNRVTIYAVSQDQIRKLSGNGPAAKFIAGFYSGRAGGSLAFVQPIVVNIDDDKNQNQQILFHEYAHHYMFSNSELAYPRWMSEGFAEFFSAAKIEKDGSIWVGRPAQGRAAELYLLPDVSVAALFDDEIYAQKKRKNEYDNFYGRSWLLYHYLFLDQQRQKQMFDYLARINSGGNEIESAKAAFGDFAALNTALKAYLNQKRLPALKISAENVPIKSVTVRRLTPGQDAVMPYRMVSKRGVDMALAKEILPKIQTVAAKFPNDVFVLATLAEAEHDAGNLDAAIAAADRALALDPRNIDALIQKGFALTRKAEASTTPSDWGIVRRHFIAVNTIENDHPIPLIYNFRSYAEQGKAPPETAVKGLEWALELAPFDEGLRWNLARFYMEKKRYGDAIFTLRPLAYDPHGDTTEAQKMLKEAVELGSTAAKLSAESGAAGAAIAK